MTANCQLPTFAIKDIVWGHTPAANYVILELLTVQKSNEFQQFFVGKCQSSISLIYGKVHFFITKPYGLYPERFLSIYSQLQLGVLPVELNGEEYCEFIVVFSK